MTFSWIISLYLALAQSLTTSAESRQLTLIGRDGWSATWNHAHQICRQRGLDLVTVDSVDVITYLREVFQDTDSLNFADVWTGLHSPDGVNSPEDYVWTNCQPFNTSSVTLSANSTGRCVLSIGRGSNNLSTTAEVEKRNCNESVGLPLCETKTGTGSCTFEQYNYTKVATFDHTTMSAGVNSVAECRDTCENSASTAECWAFTFHKSRCTLHGAGSMTEIHDNLMPRTDEFFCSETEDCHFLAFGPEERRDGFTANNTCEQNCLEDTQCLAMRYQSSNKTCTVYRSGDLVKETGWRWENCDFCPKGWSNIGQTCYTALVAKVATVDVAQALCEANGAVLMNFHTTEQNDLAAVLLSDLGGDKAITGLNDRVTEGDYRWGDLSSPTFYNWYPGEPAPNPQQEDCIMILPSGKWMDLGCTRDPFVLSYILCEKSVTECSNLPPTGTSTAQRAMAVQECQNGCDEHRQCHGVKIIDETCTLYFRNGDPSGDINLKICSRETCYFTNLTDVDEDKLMYMAYPSVSPGEDCLEACRRLPRCWAFRVSHPCTFYTRVQETTDVSTSVYLKTCFHASVEDPAGMEVYTGQESVAPVNGCYFTTPSATSTTSGIELTTMSTATTTLTEATTLSVVASTSAIATTTSLTTSTKDLSSAGTTPPTSAKATTTSLTTSAEDLSSAGTTPPTSVMATTSSPTATPTQTRTTSSTTIRTPAGTTTTDPGIDEQTCWCPCTKWNSSDQKTIDFLRISTGSFSSKRRKYSCAHDSRISAMAFGGVGIIVLVIAFGSVIVSDLPVLYRDFKGLRFVQSDSRAT